MDSISTCVGFGYILISFSPINETAALKGTRQLSLVLHPGGNLALLSCYCLYCVRNHESNIQGATVQHWKNILEYKSTAMVTAVASTQSVAVNAILVDVDKTFV